MKIIEKTLAGIVLGAASFLVASGLFLGTFRTASGLNSNVSMRAGDQMTVQCTANTKLLQTENISRTSSVVKCVPWELTPTVAVPSPTVAPPTSTATSVPTATATVPPVVPTSTFTATATIPASTTNSVAQIIADSDQTTPHDGTICGVETWSWEKTSDVQAATPEGFRLGTGWGVINWDCGWNVDGVYVTIQNFQAWVWANNTWTQVTDHVAWCDTNTPMTNGSAGPGCGGFGPTWLMPNARYSIHWASDHNSIVDRYNACAWTAYQAKRSGTPAYILADAGFDWWDGASNKGAVVGRYHRLTTDWQWINASTCSAAVLTAHPPPLQ